MSDIHPAWKIDYARLFASIELNGMDAWVIRGQKGFRNSLTLARFTSFHQAMRDAQRRLMGTCHG